MCNQGVYSNANQYRQETCAPPIMTSCVNSCNRDPRCKSVSFTFRIFGSTCHFFADDITPRAGIWATSHSFVKVGPAGGGGGGAGGGGGGGPQTVTATVITTVTSTLTRLDRPSFQPIYSPVKPKGLTSCALVQQRRLRRLCRPLSGSLSPISPHLLYIPWRERKKKKTRQGLT